MIRSKPSLAGLLLACVAALPSAASGLQAGPGGPAPTGGPPPAMMKALADHNAALLAMCPAAPAPQPGAPIHAVTWGARGPQVLIIHGGVQGGLGGAPETFRKQEALGAQGWRVRRVDRPGFGQSPTRGPDDMGVDAVWIADELGSSSHLIGHSWGGAEALLAAARRPEAVRSLVLVEPALDLLATDDPAYAADPAVRDANIKRFSSWMASHTPAEYGLAFRASVGAATPVVANAPQETPAQATDFGCSFLRARMAPVPAFREAVAAVVKARIPVLVISGGWSPAFEKADDAVARMLGARRVVVASPNHYVQLSNATDFNRVVDAFMREADRARAGASRS